MSVPGFPVPFGLTVRPMERLLVFNLAHDPDYQGVEVQAYADDRHGHGLAVLLYRHDRKVDVIRHERLKLDPESFRMGAGLGAWIERDLSEGVFRLDAQGAHLLLRFTDPRGRLVGIHIHELLDRRREPTTLLAPVSADIDHPASLLLVLLRGFDFVQQASRFTVTVDGQPRAVATLPVPVDMHRVYLARYSSEPIVVELDRALGGAVPLLADGEHALPDGSTAWRDETGGLRLLEAGDGRHLVQVPFDPPFPDLRALPDGGEAAGRWRIDIHGEASVVAGTWAVRRVGDDVEVALDVDQGWQPDELRASYALMTSVMRYFRTWPETYRWRGVVDLAADPPTVGGTWTRSEGHRAHMVGTPHQFELVRRVPVSPARLWQEVGDFGGGGKPHVRLVQAGAPEAGGVGAIREIVLNGRTFREQLVAVEPQRSMQVRLLGEAPLDDYLGTITVEAADEGALLRWNVEFVPRLPGTAWFVEWLARRAVNHAMDAMLAGAHA